MTQYQSYTFGCIPISDDEVCFDRAAELYGGFEALFSNLVGLYTNFKELNDIFNSLIY